MRKTIAGLLLLVGLGVTFVRLARRTETPPPERVITPVVMGTTARLVGVGEGADSALRSALAELQRVERLMSTWDATSELSRFNAAPAGQPFALHADTLTVLRAAQRLARRTGGAFDVTMRPLGRLWRVQARAGRLPDEATLQAALARVGHTHMRLGPAHATKQVTGLEVTLDALAKGFAVDLAVEALRRAGLTGGLVEVGGDLRCFGRPARGEAWRVGLQSPWRGEALLVLRLPAERSVAVCTSGNYRRFVTIGGRRYSHIIDPRSGRPADTAPSVTVVAPTAMAADAWATALSVLGPEEGRRLAETEPGLEALWVLGTPERPRLMQTSGFSRYRRAAAQR